MSFAHSIFKDFLEICFPDIPWRGYSELAERNKCIKGCGDPGHYKTGLGSPAKVFNT